MTVVRGVSRDKNCFARRDQFFHVVAIAPHCHHAVVGYEAAAWVELPPEIIRRWLSSCSSQPIDSTEAVQAYSIDGSVLDYICEHILSLP